MNFVSVGSPVGWMRRASRKLILIPLVHVLGEMGIEVEYLIKRIMVESNQEEVFIEFRNEVSSYYEKLWKTFQYTKVNKVYWKVFHSFS